jgi:hypothetical protein
VLAPAASRASASNDTRAGESSGQLPGTGAGVDAAEGTGVGVLLLVGTGTGVFLPDGTATGVRVADGTGTGVLTLVGTGVGVRAPVLEGTGTGLLTLDGTGVGVQSGQVGEGDGDGWRAVGVGEGPAGAGVIAPLGTGTGVVALVGTGAGVVALVGTGVGVAQPGPPAVWWAPAECLPADCAEAESSRAAGGWLGLADATASPTPPASRAAAGSPSQAIVRVPGVLMLTSSSGRPGWPAVAVGTCGRPVRLHDHRVRYATPAGRPARPELPYGERT